MTQKFTFFWESDSPFSNWYPQSFDHEGHRYNCSEQYMMYKKAMLFKDIDVAEMIMEQAHPRKQKFIMVPALVSKFTQDTYSLNCMLDTGDSIIVEASPYDKVWGIGMTQNDPRATDPTQWDGQNLLGVVLMKAREIIVNGR
jgi:predicted NAD-dependent protein-ADP-ribosyltransferase YbiA (DUF1768 family)